MAKINISFNGSDHEFDESEFAAYAEDIHRHLSTVMAGSGSTINFGGVEYNIDSEKLTNAKHDFVSHLQTIYGDGLGVVVDGNQHTIDITKVHDAIAKMHTNFLFADGTLVNTNGVLSVGQPLVKNEYGFCYDKMYACLDYGCGYIFKEDGSVEYYGIVDYDGVKATYEKFEEYPAGSFTVQEYPDEGYCILDLSSVGWDSAIFEYATELFHIYGAPCELDTTFGGTPLSALGDLWLPNDGSITEIAAGTFKGNTTLTSIKLPECINKIGDRTFMGCSSLKSIDIPDSVTHIGNSAFEECFELTSAKIPSGVTSLGASAFCNCYNLTAVNIPEGIETIDEYTFSGCSSLNSIVIPSSVKNIGYDAFYNCSSLTEINIPDGVPSIGSNAFSYCSNVETVRIPASVTTIDNAFSSCSNIKNVYYGGTLEQWCNITFTGYSSHPLSNSNGSLYISGELLSDVTIPSTLTQINPHVFYGCADITSVTIPNNITNIGTYAFTNCRNLTNVAIPDSVTNIGASAFSGCSSLEDISLPNGLPNIGSYMFSGCTNLKNIEIPSGVTRIGSYAFQNCQGLTNIEIPSCVTSIEYGAFASSGLTEIVIPDSVTTLSSSLFDQCMNLKSVTIGNGVTSIPKALLRGCSYLENLTIPFVGSSATATTASGSTLFGYIFGDYNYTGAIKINQYYNSSQYYYYYIPESLRSVTVLGGKLLYGALWGCSSLTEIVICDDVTEIGIGAFRYCNSLVSLTIPFIGSVKDDASYRFGRLFSYYAKASNPGAVPDSLTDVVITSGTMFAKSAFEACDKIVSITLPDDTTELSEHLFDECDNLHSFVIPNGVTNIPNGTFMDCKTLSDIIIPDGVKTIGTSAFYGCDAFKHIIIPASVTSIGNTVFKYCDALESVTLLATEPPSLGGHGAFEECNKLNSIIVPAGCADAYKAKSYWSSYADKIVETQ